MADNAEPASGPFEEARQSVEDYCRDRQRAPRHLLGLGSVTADEPSLAEIYDLANYLVQARGGREVSFFLVGRGMLDDYPSWLFQALGHIAVLFDLPLIRASRETAGYTLELVLQRLALHELGHLVLHELQVDDGQASGAGGYIRPEQEEEAWRFAFAVIGLAIADLARYQCQTTHIDEAWLYV
jgi:hypothetical protein